MYMDRVCVCVGCRVAYGLVYTVVEPLPRKNSCELFENLMSLMRKQKVPKISRVSHELYPFPMKISWDLDFHVSFGTFSHENFAFSQASHEKNHELLVAIS